MARVEDALELLLPDAEANVMNRARDVTHFLRLLSDDALSARAASVGIDWERARRELEQHDLRRLTQGIKDLLRHHLIAIADGESFAWYGEPVLGVQGAWRLLDDFRDELPWLAGVPEPGETPARVGERLLESLARLEASEAETSLWRARFARWTDGVRAAEKHYRTQIDRARASVPALVPPALVDDPPLARALIDGVAACLLDRGAVRDARAWLVQHAAVVGGDAHLRQLWAWTRLVLGDLAGAKSVLAGLRPWSGILPRALFELRAHRPEWLPCLAGRVPSDENDERSSEPTIYALGGDELPIRSRADLGAAVLCVFEFSPGRGTRALSSDVAPALRESLDDWLRDREGAWAVAGELEHRLVVTATAILVHREAEAALPGVLGRETARALVLVPILDLEGEVGGWLHIELEHHLVPSGTRLRRWAAVWAAELARNAARQRRSVDLTPARASNGAEPTNDACADVFRRIIVELGIKTQQRRWWGFTVHDGVLRQVASGGDGFTLDAEHPGEQRAVQRAVLTGGTVLFDEPAPKLAITAEAASGVALPLLAAKRVCGALAIESSRRRDFRDSDLERYSTVLDRGGLALRLAQFRRWHRAEFGFDLWFDVARPDFQSFAHNFLVAARSRSPVVLFGPAGSGKLVLTRWLHFENEGSSSPLKVFSCTLGPTRGGWARVLQSTVGGNLVLDDVEALDTGLQEELLCWLDGVDSTREIDGADDKADDAIDVDSEPARATRVFATTRIGLAAAVREGRLRHDLAQRLNRLELRVPSLRERREDILPLIERLAERFATEEDVATPMFTDEALALLWRQPWEGNIRELENVIYKLVLLQPSEGGARRAAIDPAHVARVARSFQLELTRKLNSRHPLRTDLIAALRVTRMSGGRINKTRAAHYMGWDPDTLVARMQDLGLDDRSELDPSIWTAEPPDVPETAEPRAAPPDA